MSNFNLIRGGVKKLICKSSLITNIVIYLIKKVKIYKSLKTCRIVNSGNGNWNKDIIGKGNSVTIGNESHLKKLTIRIRGNNNTLVIGRHCTFGPKCSIWMEGDNIKITIGQGCTFTTRCHINAQENKSQIDIGEDCMFSNHIIVRTSDSHPIYDNTTHERINKPERVSIGNHVWIAPNTKIMKGAEIANGCIIGSDTTVTKAFSTVNALIVGRPARMVKQNVSWTREVLF